MPQRTPNEPRILFVDDEVVNLRLLERVLRQGGYEHIKGTTDPRAVVGLVDESGNRQLPQGLLAETHPRFEASRRRSPVALW